MRHRDILIAGAGIMGLSLALELERRGASVTVVERGAPLSEASTAAAGMLAAHDPGNPPELMPLSRLSLALYPEYLARIEALSGVAVAFQTSSTLQSVSEAGASNILSADALERYLPQLNPSGLQFLHLDEHSIDPRQLAPALLAAVRATSIQLLTHTAVRRVRSTSSGVDAEGTSWTHSAGRFIDCTGAWASATSTVPHLAVRPVKGQMLSVRLPSDLPLQLTFRTPHLYVVPRTSGPNAGRAILGATIEDVGFDKSTHPADISSLHAEAAEFLPQLGDAEILETWAGLRPATADHLPLLGQLPGEPNRMLCTGHFRDGILLAPASAHLMAQVAMEEKLSIEIRAFSPARMMQSHN